MDVRLVDRQWGDELAACVAADPIELRIICPFIKTDAFWHVVGDAEPDVLRIITRFDLEGFAAQVSDIQALQDALDLGGEVRGVKGLHAKVFVFGERAAAVTSANLTGKGLHTNAEFGCISELPAFVERCRAYFDELWSQSKPSLTPAKLKTWDRRVKRVWLSGANPKHRKKLPDHGANVGDQKSDDLPMPPSDEVVPLWWDASFGHIKLFGQGHDREKRSTGILTELRRSGAHWACPYPPKPGRPRQPEDGDVMYLGRMVDHPHDTLIFGRAIAMQHVDSRDVASAADIEERWWKAEWPYYIRVHHGEFLAGPLSNGVSMAELMDELGAQAFASTARNLAAGKGNTNPRMALRQRPAVVLTSKGLGWVTVRFEAALAHHGRLSDDELATLDWPAVPDAYLAAS